ncbi:Gfo/Idh/MocA family protein [Arthrobacter sp. 9AX]|uniref:Gfo/Idh/MocA family protein n=1 Tax=Arthrobacter sp. 9AX TaxID=2653131 RepID=UPI00135892F9|nr:Gfo/Idh/MocA family oxidoreductase [Arthrobacter sp. 9AX]
MIGYGMSGRRFHVPLIKATKGLTLCAIMTRTPDAAAQAKAEHPEVTVVSNIDELQASGAVLGVVATPDATHSTLAAVLIERGLGVVVDKPLATSAAAGRRLVDAAAAAGVLLTSFQNRRWDSDYRTVLKVINSGVLGDITRVESSLARWFVPDASTWRGRPTDGVLAGSLGGFGSHLVDQMIAAFGRVEHVYGEVAARHRQSLVNDDVFLALRHASGVSSHLIMGTALSGERPRFMLQGTRGSFTKFGFDGQQESLMQGRDPLSKNWGQEAKDCWGHLTIDGKRTLLPSEHGDWRQFYVGLVGALEGDHSLLVDPSEVVHSLEVLEAGALSERTRQVVSV